MVHRLPARKVARLLRAEAEIFILLGCTPLRGWRCRIGPSNASQRRALRRDDKRAPAYSDSFEF